MTDTIRKEFEAAVAATGWELTEKDKTILWNGYLLAPSASAEPAEVLRYFSALIAAGGGSATITENDLRICGAEPAVARRGPKCANPQCIDGHVPSPPDGEPSPCPACTPAPQPAKDDRIDQFFVEQNKRNKEFLSNQSPGAFADMGGNQLPKPRAQPTGAAGAKALEFPAWYGIDKPWPLHDVLQELIRAANILLDEKDYDGHGHERISTAKKRAREILCDLGLALPAPESQQAQGEQDLLALIEELEDMNSGVSLSSFHHGLLAKAIATMKQRLVPAESGSAQAVESGVFRLDCGECGWVGIGSPSDLCGRCGADAFNPSADDEIPASLVGKCHGVIGSSHAHTYKLGYLACATEAAQALPAVDQADGAADAVSSVQDEVARAVASIETPPEVKGRVMSEMFWQGVYALQSALSANQRGA